MRRLDRVTSAGAAMSGVLAFCFFAPLTSTAPAFAQKPISDSGPGVQVLAPIYHRNLAIYPLRRVAGTSGGDGYLTLDEGLQKGLVEVREVGAGAPPPLVRPRPGGPPPQDLEQGAPANPQTGRALPAQSVQQSRGQSFGGDVNRLVLINHSDRKLVLLAGEMVVGGKQDRIVQKDRIILPNDKPTTIDVFCVEQGRWSNTSAGFKNAEITAGGRAGGVGGGIADPSVRGTAQAKREQSAVWDEVGKKNSALGALPGMTTYQAARTSATNLKEQEPYIEAIEGKFPSKDIVGAVVAVNGKLIWLDEFASASLFSKYWPKLMRSYVLEAVSTRPPKEMEERIRWKLPTIEEATAYLRDRAGNARFEGEEGVYKLLRIENREHVIYELTDIDRKAPLLLHVCKMEKK